MNTEHIAVQFPGGKKVTASIGDFVVNTDQPVKDGGEASAPAPFELFLASIASCAGIFALNFCQSRDLDASQLGLRMECHRDEKKRMYGLISLHLTVPEDFPDKYRAGLVRAVELCPVKKHLADAPAFEVVFDN
jgi:ribosomal protein S12 methylthiotransferase accessory factor